MAPYQLCMIMYLVGTAFVEEPPPCRAVLTLEVDMRPSYRSGVNKRRSAGKFRRAVGRTHPKNMKGAPQRGGIRL